MMTSAQVVETSVNVTSNSPSQDYTHPDDHNLPNYDMTPGFKPFTLSIPCQDPTEWKNARVTPLYKNSGKRNDPSNYRPISVIPVEAKVFERIIYDQLYDYLTKNNLSKHQSGFPAVHSTVTALLEATDSWALNIDRGGLINAVVFLDLKRHLIQSTMRFSYLSYVRSEFVD